MDVLLIYCDLDSPSKYLRYLDVGVYHQVCEDGQLKTSSVLLHADRRPEEVVDSFRRHPARVVGFYIDEFNLGPSLQLVDRLRAEFRDTPICAVGILPTLAPEKIMASPYIDYMIIGEGEIPFFELATQLGRGGDTHGIKNLWWRNGGKIERNPLRPIQENLDLLPFPNRVLFAQEPLTRPSMGRALYISASRGCPHDCLFCYSPILKRVYEGKGRYYRTRSVQHVCSEILNELRHHPYSSIRFVDEMFPLDRQWLRQFAQRAADSKFPAFECVVAAEKCDDETLDLLKAAGCSRIVIGTETGNEPFRKRIASRNHGNERVAGVITAARTRGMGIVTTNMIGLPLESEPLVQETYKLNQSLAPDEIRCTVYQPIPGTQLGQYSEDKKYIQSEPKLPDFTQLGVQLPELSAETVRSYLYRMHFLNLINKLRSFPKSEGYYDFLADLSRAKFRLSHSGAVDVGVVNRGELPFGYLAIEAGSECRYSLEMQAYSLARFSLFVPEASMRRIQHAGASVIAEVAWVVNGEEQTLFSRFIGSRDERLMHQWQDCVAAGGEETQTGELVFRVSVIPHSDLRVFVFWGMPSLIEEKRVVGSMDHFRSEYEGRLKAQADEIAMLQQTVESARAAEQAARQERDQKVQRIGELQIRLLELEKQLQTQSELLAELDQLRAEKEAGLTGRLKGMFKK